MSFVANLKNLFNNISQQLKKSMSLITSEKEKPTLLIESIKIGGRDNAGNLITDVLALGNEYAIYEIDHRDVNYRLRISIDGKTNQSEEILIERFNKVKQKYIEAKGLLYKSTNYGMMKNRVAHMLASCLSSDKIDGNKEFEILINVIKEEYLNIIKRRVYYLIPCVVGTVGLFILSLYAFNDRPANEPYWQLIVSTLAASLGGTLSILINAKKSIFEEYTTTGYYFLIGLERIILAIFAGAVVFIAIKAGFLISEKLKSNFWQIMLVMVISGFSESFAPNIIGKMEGEQNK